MKTHNYSFHILVNGKPITEYSHEGKTFIEGRKNSEFEIQIKNHSYVRVLAIPSVDGLNTLDGKPASTESKGYIINANDTLTVPGWTIDNSAVAKFIFKSKEQSYANFAAPDTTTNVGVIGFIVFQEKQIQYHNPVSYPPYYTWMNPINICDANTHLRNINIAASSHNTLSQSSSIASVYHQASQTESTSVPQNAATNDSFSLGTGFGDKSNFSVTSASFNRGAIIGQPVMYYDTRNNLIRRGVTVKQEKIQKLPEAFPGIGCKIPPGYKG